MNSIFDFFINEDRYPNFDSQGAVARLSSAIRCETITSSPKDGSFEKLHRIIEEGFPAIMSAGSVEILRNSLLIEIKGSNLALKPALFMSHLDVVPIVSGTEKDWTFPPFSGAVEEGYIWGRGTEDIKQQVFGSLEAFEYLLEHGKKPLRTVYFAFGDDEETFNEGSRMIANVLESRGISLEFLLDEGGGKVYDAADFGAPGVMISDINLMEKGYADLELSVESCGGHSSNPFGGTSLEILSAAINAVCSNPFPVRMNSILMRTFNDLKDYITEEPLKSYMSAEKPDENVIAEYCFGVKELFPYVTTTIAPTMIEGGSQACNVMPQNMRAVINFRIAEGVTPEEIMEHCREVINDERVNLKFLQSNSPSQVSDADSFAYSKLVESLRCFYRDIHFVPLVSAGATDARSYENICNVCLRCSPFIIPNEDESGVHGTNERLLIRSYIQGIRVLIDIMEHTLY